MRLIDAKVVEWKVEQFLQYRYEDYGMMFGPGLEILNIIRNAPTIEPKPNAPLTLDELREMEGGPVFIKSPGHLGHWALVQEASDGNIYFTASNGTGLSARVALRYGGKVYRRKPEEGTT